ncbi:MAG: DUF4233 domain-containing protein [Actinophytocola sp.]|nr:DUF4233 domain-containing protein [Actinophytocola sp.]
MTESTQGRVPSKDPMKGFRGVMAGTLIMEAITVALALPVIARLGGGITSSQGWAAMAVVAALIACCFFLRRPWITAVVIALQVALIAFFVSSKPVGVIGLLFLAVWGYLFWLRRDVAKRMAQGRLPSQQEQPEQ